MVIRKTYSIGGLTPKWKKFVRQEIKRIGEILKNKGCRDLEFSYGEHFFGGFFTAPSGQKYHIFSSDRRYYDYVHLVYRTVRDYTDYNGGLNQRIDLKDLDNIPII